MVASPFSLEVNLQIDYHRHIGEQFLTNQLSSFPTSSDKKALDV